MTYTEVPESRPPPAKPHRVFFTVPLTQGFPREGG